MADDQDQGYVPLYQPGAQKPAQTQTAPPPQPPASAPPPVKDPNDQGYVPLVTKPAQTQQTTGGGQGAAQPGDWSTVALNEAAMYSLPGLRAQAAAARQRLGPVAAASADIAGNYGSPTTALNFVPYVGPELAGGMHEGIKSYMSQPDWMPNSAELAQIGKDTAGGVVGGSSATALARQSQILNCSSSAQAASVRRLLISSRHGSPVRS